VLADRLLDDIAVMQQMDKGNSPWNMVELKGGTRVCTQLALKRRFNLGHSFFVEPDEQLRDTASSYFESVTSGLVFVVIDSDSETLDSVLSDELPGVEIDAIVCSGSMYLLVESKIVSMVAKLLKHGKKPIDTRDYDK
jgi:hypothetical protein